MKRTRPNILFFFTDDQRFDTIAALGNERISTPNIDALVARGTAFTHAHIPCGSHGAVCMPSRAMLHTGRTLYHLQGAGESIPPEHTTLGEALRANGYRAFGTGKWHNGPPSYHRSFSDGDEIFFGGMTDHWNVPAYHYDPTGRYDEVRLVTPDYYHSNDTVARRCDHIQPGKHSTELVCDAAVDFINGYDGEAPFFAYVSFLAPHDPRTMPERFRKMYDPESMELPPNFAAGHPFDNGHLHNRDEMLGGFPRTWKEVRRHLAEYYAMISHLDHELGRVMKALEDQGLADETIILFAGDNGLAVGQHGLMGKQNCYEHSVRVPLIFAGPGIPAGQRRDAYVYLLDIFPTLCELLEMEAPASVEGRSLAPAIRDPSVCVRDVLYFGFADKQRAVKDDQYKLIEYAGDGTHNMTQLFDITADPWELHNLAGNPEFAGELAEMRARLLRCRDEWDDVQSPVGESFWRVCKLDGRSAG